jgi:hypothetical protein
MAVRKEEGEEKQREELARNKALIAQLTYQSEQRFDGFDVHKKVSKGYRCSVWTQ